MGKTIKTIYSLNKRITGVWYVTIIICLSFLTVVVILTGRQNQLDSRVNYLSEKYSGLEQFEGFNVYCSKYALKDTVKYNNSCIVTTFTYDDGKFKLINYTKYFISKEKKCDVCSTYFACPLKSEPIVVQEPSDECVKYELVKK